MRGQGSCCTVLKTWAAHASRVATPREDGRYCVMNDALAYQVERIRAMTVEEKLRLSHALWEEAWKVSAAGVRARHPNWSDAEVAAGVRVLLRDAGQ